MFGDESVWVWAQAPKESYWHLLGRRDFAAPSSQGAAPIVAALAPGTYHVRLLKGSYYGRGTFAFLANCVLWRGAKTNGVVERPVVTVAAGDEARLRFPHANDCGTADYWVTSRDELLERPLIIDGNGNRRHASFPVSCHDVPAAAEGPDPCGDAPDPYWLELYKLVRSYQAFTCPILSAPLREAYREVTTTPPSAPVVRIRATTDEDLRLPVGDAEADAPLVRRLIQNVKDLCWGWFPLRRKAEAVDAPLADQLKATVTAELAKLDRLERIADILDDVARRESAH
jgi:hypothetical protein